MDLTEKKRVTTTTDKRPCRGWGLVTTPWASSRTTASAFGVREGRRTFWPKGSSHSPTRFGRLKKDRNDLVREDIPVISTLHSQSNSMSVTGDPVQVTDDDTSWLEFVGSYCRVVYQENLSQYLKLLYHVHYTNRVVDRTPIVNHLSSLILVVRSVRHTLVTVGSSHITRGPFWLVTMVTLSFNGGQTGRKGLKKSHSNN